MLAAAEGCRGMRVARSGPTRLTEGKDGGPDRDRTVDLLIAIQVDWGSASSNAFIKPFLTSRGEPDDRRHVVTPSRPPGDARFHATSSTLKT